MLLLRRAPVNLLYERPFTRVSVSASGCVGRSLRWQSTQSGDPWPTLQSLQELRQQDPANPLFNREPKELKHARFDGECFHSVYVSYCSAPSLSHLTEITLTSLLALNSQVYSSLHLRTSPRSCLTPEEKQIDPSMTRLGSLVPTHQKQTGKRKSVLPSKMSKRRPPSCRACLQSKVSSGTRLLSSTRPTSASPCVKPWGIHC